MLKAAEEAGFEVLLTTDTNLPHQQNLKGSKLAIVILSKNKWSLVRPMMQQIANAVNTVRASMRLVDRERRHQSARRKAPSRW